MTSIQYPGGGPNYSYAYDTMGRLSTMNGLSGIGSISATYDLANRLTSLSGNLSESRDYNVMGQLTGIQSPITGVAVLHQTYSYSSTQNNGKITSQTDSVSGETVVYTYDSLNRLASAAATSGSWGQSYGYDGFGNLTNQTVTAGTAPSLSVVYNASNNLQTTDCADANGNILTQSVYPYTCSSTPSGTEYTYDVANRLHPPTLYGVGSFYSYAPGNKRVWRGTVNGTGTTTLDEISFWSVTGQKLVTYNLLSGELATANAYFGGRLISNNTGIVVTDRLGSVGKYYPWGQEKPSATANGTEKFTGYFRDAETGLDYAKNRYHQPGMGRFMSPDPYGKSAKLTIPGSWNRYAYVGGDPVNRVDRKGLESYCTDDDCDESDTGNDYDCIEQGGYWADDGSGCTFAGGSVSNTGITFSNVCQLGEQVLNGQCDVPLDAFGQSVLAAINGNNPQGFINFAMAVVAAELWIGEGILAAADASILIAATNNTILLGQYVDGYVTLGGVVGASTFSIPSDVWNEMTAAQQLAANQAFLNAAISNNAQIIFSSNPLLAPQGSGLLWEANYLIGQGFQIVQDANGGWIAVRP